MATMKQHKASTKNLKKARKSQLRKTTITGRAKSKVKAVVRKVKRKVKRTVKR